MKNLLLGVLVFPILAWAAQSPFDGTWKADLSTAQFPEKPTVLVLQNGMYQNHTSVPKINIKADGTDQSVAGMQGYNTLAVKIVDDKTVETTAKKDGKIVSSSRSAVSADGKTVMIEFTSYPETSKQPVTGKLTQVRVAAGPPGSHAISGSWRMHKVDAVSENALTATLKCSDDGLTYSGPTGQSYEAKFDGSDYPIRGAAGTTVSLVKVNDRSIISTTKRDGKIVSVDHMTVSADGKTMTIKSENRVQGTTTTLTATKQ